MKDHQKSLLAGWLIAGLVFILAACQSETQAPAQTQKLTPSVSPSLIPIQTHSPAPTSTPTPSATVTATPLELSSPTPIPSPTFIYENAFAVDFSADGRSLAFNSSIDGLVPEDQNHSMDPFIYQTENGAIQKISAQKEDQSGNSISALANNLSANGQYLLFGGSSNGPEPASEHYNFVYLRDLKTGQDKPIDFTPLEKQLSAMSIQAKLSPDGRYLALEVYSSSFNIFLLNRATGAITPVSGLPDGQPTQGNSYEPTFSSDGRYLAFVSDVSNLITGDTSCSETNPTCGDVFLFEITTGKLTRIPAHLQFTLGNPYPYLTVSKDARWLAWTEVVSHSSFFPPVIRLFDRTTGKTETICAGEEPLCIGHSPSISADGRWLAFATMAATDAHGNRLPDSYAQIYLYDHQTGQLSLISADSLGKPGNGDSGTISLQSEGFSSDVRISGDGRFVAFSSQAANLLPEGTQKRQCFSPSLAGAYPCYDLFLYDRQKKTLNWISRPR